MAKPSYYDQLRDPRWQRKRLEIMQRADFACEACGATDRTLNVHHGYYEKGRSPWEYDDETLHCYCEECHDNAADVLRDIHYEIGKLDCEDLRNLMTFAIMHQQWTRLIVWSDVHPDLLYAKWAHLLQESVWNLAEILTDLKDCEERTRLSEMCDYLGLLRAQIEEDGQRGSKVPQG